MTRLALWTLIVVYAVARVLQGFANTIPMLVIVALHVLPPACFALLHGAKRYGLRGMLVFTVLCLAVGNGFENLSILTGFPFGHYYFTDGPRDGTGLVNNRARLDLAGGRRVLRRTCK